MFSFLSILEFTLLNCPFLYLRSRLLSLKGLKHWLCLGCVILHIVTGLCTHYTNKTNRKYATNTHSNTKAIQKVKNVRAYSPRTCSVAADHWFMLLSVMLKSCLKQLYVGTCHVVSAKIAVAMAAPIENPADCEVRGFIRFLQADDILGYLAEEASFRLELFCFTTVHVRILPGRHKPFCVGNYIGTSSSILLTVRTWHRRTFSCFQNWRSTLLVNALKIMKTWSVLVE